MVGFRDVRAEPFNADNFDVELAVKKAVDQMVIDGEVDGVKRRARLGLLGRTAFRGARAPSDLFHEFVSNLPKEPRFVDEIDYEYGYRPEIDDCDLRPSMR